MAGDGDRVLDVGAGDRCLEAVLRARVGGLTYQSVDPDPERTHDYRSLEEVQDRHDLITCLEVIEHLSSADAVALLAAARHRPRAPDPDPQSRELLFERGQHLHY